MLEPILKPFSVHKGSKKEAKKFIYCIMSFTFRLSWMLYSLRPLWVHLWTWCCKVEVKYHGILFATFRNYQVLLFDTWVNSIPNTHSFSAEEGVKTGNFIPGSGNAPRLNFFYKLDVCSCVVVQPMDVWGLRGTSQGSGEDGPPTFHIEKVDGWQ